MNLTDKNIPPWRGIFANRTLNLRAIKAIGYDMDYTLIHYRVEEWERRAYEYVRDKIIAATGWPLEDLTFDPDHAQRGLFIDQKLGNIIKANRFGYVKAAAHGTRMLPFDELRRTYARTVVGVGDPRFRFLNTLFALSESSLYGQLVDMLDAETISGHINYHDLYEQVRKGTDEAHMEGALKAEIIADPDRFVELDPDLPLALLDQRHSGKKLALITNSGWNYSREMMTYAFDRYMPKGQTWKDLFDLIIVSSRKPGFFMDRSPAFEVVDQETGALMPIVGGLELGKCYLGGPAEMVEECLGLDGEQILYVGDHVYGDVNVSKSVRRWRTGLVVRELEGDIIAQESFKEQQALLESLMADKVTLEFQMSRLRLAVSRVRHGYGPPTDQSRSSLEEQLSKLRSRVVALDDQIGPLAATNATLNSEKWGLLMRAGNDKSHMARQVERHADVYMSRVSNFAYATPFHYLRSVRGSLPHDVAGE